MISLYVKLGAAAALLAVIFGLGWHLGGLSGQAALARLQHDQAQITATAVLNERASTQAEVNRLNKVVATYENAPPDPISVGIAHRVYLYANTSCPAVPKAPADPGGTIITRTEPRGFEDALQGYVDACARDALRLNAIQAAWPK